MEFKQALAWTIGALLLGCELSAVSVVMASPSVGLTHSSVIVNPASVRHPLLQPAGKAFSVRPLMPAPAKQTLLAMAQPTVPPLPSKSKQGKAKQVVKTVHKKTTFHKNYPALDALQGGSSNNFSAYSANMGLNTGVRVVRSGIVQQKSSIDLTMGKADAIYLSRPVSRVAVSNPAVASAVIISPTQIELLGKGIGVANVLLWGDSNSPEHSVLDISVHRDVSVLEGQLRYVDSGIEIVPMAAADTVILTGEAETREAAQLAIELAKAFFNGSSGPSSIPSASSSGSSSPGSSAMGSPASIPAGGGASAGNASTPTSRTPGSALPGFSTNVINLIKVKGEPSTKLELVQNKLKEIDPAIRIDVVPGSDGMEKVILSGRVATVALASKALNMASVFYGKPGLKVVTAQGGTDFSRMLVDGSSSSSGSKTDVTVKSGQDAGAANMLQGSVMTDSSGNVISMIEIAQKPQIRCGIKFLEINKTALNAFGSAISGAGGPFKFTSWSGNQSPAPGRVISVPSSQNPPGADWLGSASKRGRGGSFNPVAQTVGSSWNEVYQNGVTQVLSINNQLNAAIQAMEEKRQVRTLAEPTLTMMSGEQGSFLAGGEVPIAFLGGNGQISIEFKQYGIRLNLLPTATDDGKIQMSVAPEVSAVDPSISVQGVPGFITRRMNTSLLVEPGQSFVLAGLFKQEDTDSVNRLPGLGSLPVIGTFFKNQWRSRNGNEMVVIVKPEIVYSETGPSPVPAH